MGVWGNLAKIIAAILLMLGGIPAYNFIYNSTKNAVVSVILLIVYEVIIFIGGFFLKVWQKVEGKLEDRIADQIDYVIQSIFSGYRRHYYKYITYQHRFFDVKGLRVQGPYNLELDKVFVQLSVDPTPIQQVTSNPIQQIPKQLFSGTHSIWEYINAKGIGNYNLAILGSPGCGKTTLLKHIALTLVAPARQRKKIGAPELFPILLFLRDHADDIKTKPDIKLAELISNQFKRREAPIPPEGWLDKQLESGNCLIMFDGLDEVADLTIRKNVVIWVEKCMSAYGNNRFIISSRPHGYKTNPLGNVTILQVRPFTSGQVKQFIHNWYLANELMSAKKDDLGIRADAKQGADDLFKRIYDTPTLSELSVNPLLLTMIATVHRYRSSLPGRRVELYAEICEVFLGKRHEARGLDSNLTPAQKQRVIQPLAYYMMQYNLRGISQTKIRPVISEHLASVDPNMDCEAFIKEIENTSGLFVERESGEYSFSHLTFQEYLASIHVLENRLEDELVKHVTDSWWNETIRLYCAQTDASNIIRVCLDDQTILSLGLAIDCMDEAREVNSQVRKIYNEIIEKGIESSDPERRRLISEAYLKTRLKER